jgi:hypothetical protein
VARVWSGRSKCNPWATVHASETMHSIDHRVKCARASASHTCVTCGLSRGFPELIHAQALLLLLGVHEVLRRTDRLLPSLHTRARA